MRPPTNVQFKDFDISWKLPEDDGGKPITNYRVFIKEGDLTPTADEEGFISVAPADMAFSFSGLNFNTLYFVWVAAENEVGAGPFDRKVAQTLVTVPQAGVIASIDFVQVDDSNQNQAQRTVTF